MKWSWMHLWMNDVKLIHMVIPFFYQSCLANDSQHFVPWSLKHSTTMLQPFAQVIEHCWDHAHALHNFIISMEMHNCMSLYAMRTCGIFVKIKINLSNVIKAKYYYHLNGRERSMFWWYWARNNKTTQKWLQKDSQKIH